MKIDIQDIKLVAAIARSGSITAGAAAVNLALGSASERLRTLEESLGTPLFERAARGVKVTGAGEAFLRHALPILTHHESLRQEMQEFTQGKRGRIRVAANSLAIAQLLGEPLTGFLLDHPHLQVDVEEMPTDRALTAVLDAAADLGVGVVHGSFTNLTVVPLLEEELVAVVGAGHPLAERPQASFHEILEYELLTSSSSSAVHQFLQDRAEQLGKKILLRARMRDSATICRMAARGVGVGIVFRSVAERGPGAAPLNIVSISDAWSHRQVSAFWATGRPAAESRAALVEVLKAAAAGVRGQAH
ncbi:MAG: LysR substrate-binding domain-containing protein [Burkholderiaceae bacterium]